jgi:hypothetical protein
MLAALALLAAAVGGAVAQDVTTTGQIRGRVQDPTGQPVADAAVQARNVATGLQREGRTGPDGLYALPLLPPGIYQVTARRIGYQPVSVSVRVTLGGATPVPLTLAQAAVALEAIVATAEVPPIDVADGGVTQYVGQAQIEQLPSLGRDFVDFVNLSGLVATDPGETTGGQFSIAGQRASQTSIQIDGVDANNSFFGENRGGSRIPFVFSIESVQELQIITNGFDVEHGSFSGGIVNVLTRSGTNNLRASLYGNFRNDALTSAPFISDSLDPEITRDYSVQQFAGNISGPIIRDKLFFFASADAQRRREPQLPLTRERFGPGGENEDAVVFDEMGRAFDILENQYGIADAAAGYRPFSTSNDALTLFGRLDWSLSNNHRLSVRHNYSTYSNDNEWNGVFDFAYGRSRAEELKDVSHSFVSELQSVLGANTFNVVRLQIANEKRPRQGRDLRPTLTVNLSNGRQIRYGGTFVSFNNNLEETKFQLVDNFTKVMGKHSLKLGANFIYADLLNAFQAPGSQNQSAGEFRFASLNDFENFAPSFYFRPIQQGGGIPTSQFGVVEWALYAQDSWRVTPKLTATLGLRYDQQSFRDSPVPVVDVEQSFGFETGFAPTDNNNVSPRLSLAYDFNGDGRAVARAGIGYFFGRVPYVVGGNVLQTERPLLEVGCGGSIADGDPDAPPRPTDYGSWALDGADNPVACAGSSAASGLPTYTLWNRDFQFPETIKANLGLERVLGSRTKVSLDFLYSRTTNLYTVRNLNLRDPQFELDGEGGRRVFTPANEFDPVGGNAVAARRSLEFGDVLVNFNDGRARSFIGMFELNHRFGSWLNFAISYTHTRAYDNSPYSCCTAGGGYADPSTGVFGPNDIGGFGDTERSWGRSDYARRHGIAATAFLNLPLGVSLTAFWKSQSGRPWTVVGDDDLNGDGLFFNDRPFVFAPDNLPLAATGEAADAERAAYTSLLAQHACVGDYVGGIIERNSCEFPWTHQFDVRLTKGFGTVAGQRAEFQIDFFNVLNGIGRLFCNDSAADFSPTSGTCGWGRVTGVFAANRDLLHPRAFDPTTQQILYDVNENFGQEDLLGSNLVLQFQVQLGFRYFF